MAQKKHVSGVGAMLLLGAIAGALLAESPATQPFELIVTRRHPLPHLVDKYPGGFALRFAMVHDVIHERFPKHGDDYYRERNRLARAGLDKLAKSSTTRQPTQAEWNLMDDLSVGLVHLGQFDEAIAIMRSKLARQQALNITGRDLYSTYANLGTAMMIDALTRAQAGVDFTDELSQSLPLIKQSIEVNPMAHFGREVWQVVLGEYLLAAANDKNFMGKFDMVGDSLEFVGNPVHAARFNRDLYEGIESSEMTEEKRAKFRGSITELWIDPAWEAKIPSFVKSPYPFDEPALAIVGMWRYGAGANAHFSLALAEIMSRVGQNHIAWCAYERTVRFLNPTRNEGLIRYCRLRQETISGLLDESSDAVLRPAFEADLRAGLNYQAAYQEYEAKAVQSGKSVDDPHFYDSFLAEHGDIASPPGEADYTIEHETPIAIGQITSRRIVLGCLLAGLLAFSWALFRPVKHRAIAS